MLPTSLAKYGIFWNFEINCTILENQEQFATIEIQYHTWEAYLSAVYAKCSKVPRRILWEGLKNASQTNEDKDGGNEPNLRSMDDFHDICWYPVVWMNFPWMEADLLGQTIEFGKSLTEF